MYLPTSHNKKTKPGHLLTLLICLLGLQLSCDNGGPQIPRLSQNAKILAFGDSLTYGTGTRAENSYPAQLERIIGRKVIQDGHPGESTSEGLERLPKSLSKHNPTLLILCLGGNDFLRREKPSTIYVNLKKMIDIAKKRRIPVVLIGVPSFSISSVLGANPEPLYQRLAKEANLPFLENTLPELLTKKQYKSDAVHLNAQGYGKLAEALAELLKRSGAI